MSQAIDAISAVRELSIVWNGLVVNMYLLPLLASSCSYDCISSDDTTVDCLGLGCGRLHNQKKQQDRQVHNPAV